MDIVERMKQGEKITIGMVHLLPLPGTLHYGGEIAPIIERAVADARRLEAAGFDAIIVENVNDAPNDAPPMSPWQISTFAIAATMSAAACICDRHRCLRRCMAGF